MRLLSVGRLIEKKGFVFLVEACRLLRASGIEFVCEIVGEGPERGRLEELIKVLSALRSGPAAGFLASNEDRGAPGAEFHLCLSSNP